MVRVAIGLGGQGVVAKLPSLRACYGIRRLVTCTASMAEPRLKVAGEMFRAITRTVLLDHAVA